MRRPLLWQPLFRQPPFRVSDICKWVMRLVRVRVRISVTAGDTVIARAEERVRVMVGTTVRVNVTVRVTAS